MRLSEVYVILCVLAVIGLILCGVTGFSKSHLNSEHHPGEMIEVLQHDVPGPNGTETRIEYRVTQQNNRMSVYWDFDNNKSLDAVTYDDNTIICTDVVAAEFHRKGFEKVIELAENAGMISSAEVEGVEK